ncbi:MAG TPA: hypothetical protein VLB06_08280 [Sulfuricaulis sp.]|nr:hypothetical protein [Sulfuricaulis sp.]
MLKIKLLQPFLSVVIIIATLVLVACAIADLKDYGDQAVKAGLTIGDMKKRIGVNPSDWEKPAYYLPNGNAVYVESVGPSVGYKGCDFHWEVNAQGRVVGYRTVGDRCW